MLIQELLILLISVVLRHLLIFIYLKNKEMNRPYLFY